MLLPRPKGEWGALARAPVELYPCEAKRLERERERGRETERQREHRIVGIGAHPVANTDTPKRGHEVVSLVSTAEQNVGCGSTDTRREDCSRPMPKAKQRTQIVFGRAAGNTTTNR